MSNYFTINGYWKDDHTEFTNCVVKSTDDSDYDNDDDIFYYGLSENDIKECIKFGEDTALEFVITSYEPLNEPSDETKV